jgi:Na+/proline symporter
MLAMLLMLTPTLRATGATIQILLFAVLAIEVKRKAPTAHTVLEIVLIRWGRTAHTIFLVFCLLTNCIVTAMLILGGAAVVAALTGVPPQSHQNVCLLSIQRRLHSSAKHTLCVHLPAPVWSAPRRSVIPTDMHT